VVLFGDRLRRSDEDLVREAEFFRRCRAQAAKGRIRIRIPPEVLKRWQQGAEGPCDCRAAGVKAA
jgi:hypothetical protein